MIPAPIGVLLALLARELAGNCPILTSASQSGAVKRSEFTIPAAPKNTAPGRGKKTPRKDGK